MAESSELTIDRKLNDIFSEGYELYKELETTSLPFNSPEFQDKVRKCTRLFEDSTRLVSLVGIFSSNENIKELQTEHLQYLLLPFYLGQLTTKNVKHDREEVLKIAEIYYKDFIKRCEDYEICSMAAKNDGNVTIREEDTSIRSLIQEANDRNSKIQQYRQRKELDEQIKELKICVERDQIDDDVKRDFYMKMIKLAIIDSNDELKSIRQELEILAFRSVHLQNNENTDHGRFGGASASQHKITTRPKVESLKPIIITKDATQKTVFGLGYPSLPVMTVNEFYDERVREGIFPNAEKVAEMNKQLLQRQDSAEKEDMENAEKEILEENDDPEYLERQRRMDDYKDFVRRGQGNRYNRS